MQLRLPLRCAAQLAAARRLRRARSLCTQARARRAAFTHPTALPR
jgi:hypothetical protein